MEYGRVVNIEFKSKDDLIIFHGEVMNDKPCVVIE